MPLSKQDKKYFKTIGHHLKPIVQLGENGFTDAVAKELDARLEDHELIKIKLAGLERDERAALLSTIADTLSADLVQRIGHTALLYRAASQPNPRLSNILRAAQ